MPKLKVRQKTQESLNPGSILNKYFIRQLKMSEDSISKINETPSEKFQREYFRAMDDGPDYEDAVDT